MCIDEGNFIRYNIFMSNIHTSLYNYMRDYRSKSDEVAIVRGRHKMRCRRFFVQIDRVAAGLYALGVRKGDVVMLALPNIEQSVVATYAVSRLGAIASMIHPKLSVDEFERAFCLHKPKVVFLSDINLRKFSPLCKGAKIVICPFLAYAYIGLPHAKEFDAFDGGDGEDPMFYMQSGGTSGAPKTIVLSSRSANAMADNLFETLDDKFSERNAMLVVMPMFHGFGLCAGMHASLSTNMRLVLMPQFSAKAATKAIARNGVTTMLAVPRMVSKLLAYKDFCGKNIASIEDVYVGGDSVNDELVRSFQNRMAECGAKARISPGYGLTETVTVCVLTYPQLVTGSVGKPIKRVECRVVDENLDEVSVGDTGELIISSEQTMTCYFNDEAATKAALVEKDGKVWVRTGDIFRADERGNLYFVGRKKRLIKISGMNVFPSEIEKTARELDFVKECVAVEYMIMGKNFIKLIVEGVLDEGQKREIISHISRRLSHWNVPSIVECVEEFPRTSVGKIDFVRLSNEHRQN